jgi:hypothetical protein
VAVTSPRPTSVRRQPIAVDEPVVHTQRKAVQWWAYIGAAFVIFWAYVLIRWVTGPYFHHVSSGPDSPPLYMKIAMDTWQIASVPIVGFLFWRLLIRPWRRDGVVSFDGLVIPAALVMALQDPLSDYTGQVYNYNAYLVNMGSYVNDIPGWRSFGAPGAQSGYPFFFHILAYGGGVIFCMWFGCKIMSAAQRRWGLGTIQLVVLCFVTMMVFDFIIEAVIWMPFGFYTMPGGHLSLFPNSYHKYPMYENLVGAAWWTAWPALRFFKNDRGETLVERGIGDMAASPRRKTTLRLLAIIGVFQIGYLVTYNLPIALFWAPDPGVWPKAIQQTSYFNDHLCGQGTNRLCPGQGIPLTMDSWVNLKGQLQGPAASQFRSFPLRPNAAKAFHGTALGFSSN